MTKLVAAARKFQDRCAAKYFLVKDWMTRREEGASLVEYALLVALIALVAIAAVKLVGTQISGAFNNAKNALDANGVK